MKLLITGGSGFIGSYLTKNLSYNIFAPSSKELDLLDSSSVTTYFNKHKFDVIIHCAIVGRDSYNIIDKNIENSIMTMFYNIDKNNKSFGKLINIGSGAEFDINTDISNVSENEIFNRVPTQSYGYAKNKVARLIKKNKNYYNLRVFSCIDPSESDNRLLKRFKNHIIKNKSFNLEYDRYNDFISLEDLKIVIDNTVKDNIHDNDLNVVYKEKLKVSDVLYKYCNLHNINTSIVKIIKQSNNNYTGDGTKLSLYKLNLKGIDSAIKRY